MLKTLAFCLLVFSIFCSWTVAWTVNIAQIAIIPFLVFSDMNTVYPHNKAVLKIPAASSKDQHWFIEFWAWDIHLQKKRRKKLYKWGELLINSIEDLRERKRVCLTACRDINAYLATGGHLDEEKAKKMLERQTEAQIKQNFTSWSITDAINHGLKKKEGLRPSSYKTYKKYCDKFKAWLVIRGWERMPYLYFTPDHFQAFIDHIIEDVADSNRTVNNYISFLGSIFLTHKRVTPHNPANGIIKLSEKIGRNLAFNSEQQARQIKFMKENNLDHILHFVLWMYYTMARPNELTWIKLGDIHRFSKNKVFLHADYAKNDMDRHITLHPSLLYYIEKMKLQDKNPEWFLFSKGLKPGPSHYLSNEIARQFRRNVLDKLGYDHDYTMYSWKHTAVVNAYKAGMSIASIQIQAGWKNASSFNKYLKSLGLVDNPEYLEKFPELAV